MIILKAKKKYFKNFFMSFEMYDQVLRDDLCQKKKELAKSKTSKGDLGKNEHPGGLKT
jgi:hypothetical protein